MKQVKKERVAIRRLFLKDIINSRSSKNEETGKLDLCLDFEAHPLTDEQDAFLRTLFPNSLEHIYHLLDREALIKLLDTGRF